MAWTTEVDSDKCAEGTYTPPPPGFPGCYGGPKCVEAGKAHGCYDCSMTEKECDAHHAGTAYAGMAWRADAGSCLEGSEPRVPGCYGGGACQGDSPDHGTAGGPRDCWCVLRPSPARAPPSPPSPRGLPST